MLFLHLLGYVVCDSLVYLKNSSFAYVRGTRFHSDHPTRLNAVTGIDPSIFLNRATIELKVAGSAPGNGRGNLVFDRSAGLGP